MLQSKKICMVEDDFIIWNLSTMDTPPKALYFQMFTARDCLDAVAMSL